MKTFSNALLKISSFNYNIHPFSSLKISLCRFRLFLFTILTAYFYFFPKISVMASLTLPILPNPMVFNNIY